MTDYGKTFREAEITIDAFDRGTRFGFRRGVIAGALSGILATLLVTLVFGIIERANAVGCL